MSGHTPTHNHHHWHHDPALRLLLVALGIVLAVFLVALALMAQSAATVSLV
jgi:hypothetical protein